MTQQVSFEENEVQERLINTQQIHWINYLRGISIVGVILLHVSGFFLKKYGSIPLENWWIGNFYDSLVRFCVPVFLMLTGMLIFQKDYDLICFLRKRYLRIVLPFFFWTFIYLSIDIISNNRIFNLELLRWSVKKIFNGVEFHFWYIYLILGLYLFIPIISTWLRNSKFKEIPFFIALWIYTLFANLINNKNFLPDIYLLYFSGYMGYLITGFYIYKRTFASTFWLRTCGLLFFIVGFLITAFGTYYSTVYKGYFSGIFYEYLTPNVLLSSIGIVLFFKDRIITLKPVHQILTFLSRYSLGIYLSHYLILKLFDLHAYKGEVYNLLWNIPIITLCCLLVSTGIIYSLSQIKFLKPLIG